MPDVGIGPTHVDLIALKELSGAVNRLSPAVQKAFFSVVIDEDSYEAVAEQTGCPVGTLKSRVHRALFNCARWRRSPADL
jgi:RNA polymerase sigma-70 factor, ECF subfamily